MNRVLKSIGRFFRQVFCVHAWECISDVSRCTAFNVQYKCSKCGKIEGLYT